MSKLFLLYVLLFTSLLNAQSITGTWIGAYHRDKPGDSRVFFYRLSLKQVSDTLLGLCEALDALADFNGLQPEKEVAVTSKQMVYNYRLDTTNRRSFHLYANAPFENSLNPANPTFLGFNCIIIPADETLTTTGQLIYSNIPSVDGVEADLRVKKISDSVCDLSVYENWIPASFLISAEFHLPKLFSQRSKKEEVIHTTEPVLPMEQRVNEVQAVIQTDSRLAKIDLYDNGEIDNDTVSLFFNGKELIKQKRISLQPLHLEVELDTDTENRLILFAHNMGDFPPNTALLIVTAGNKQHRLTLSESLQKNAVVIMKVQSTAQKQTAYE